MSRIHYFGDGYLLEKEGEVRQSTWVCLFNPSSRAAEYRFTFYYERSEPTTLSLTVAAKTGINRHLVSCPEVHQNERFGAKVEASEPGVVQITTGYYGLEDKHDWYTRAMHSVICGTRLSKKNYYADALVIDNPGKRLKEPEWAFILNPNLTPANVVLHAFYASGKKINYPFTVGAERVLPIFMDELVIKNTIFGAYYTSDVPVAVQQTRLIEEEDRKTIRACFSVMARTDLKG
jgi:hypothetical protein